MFKRKSHEVDLTTDAYRRWLRACRPQPLTWFLGLSVVEQDALADMGDEYVQDVCLGVGWAVRDPEAASTGAAVAGGDLDAEQDLLAKLAAAAAQKIVGSRRPVPAASRPVVPITMSDVAARRVNAERSRQDAKNSRRSFAGRKPDAIPRADA